MKTARVLLTIGGALNALFLVFHGLLGWRIHHASDLAPGMRAVVEMLNAGGAVTLLFLAVVSLALADELLRTRVGRAVLVLAVALFVLRALGEVTVTPAFHVVIFSVCLATAALYGVALGQAYRAAHGGEPRADDHDALRPGMPRSSFLP